MKTDENSSCAARHKTTLAVLDSAATFRHG